MNIFGFDIGAFCLKSGYTPLLGFEKSEYRARAEQYILDEAQDFFENLLRIPVLPTQLSYPDVIGVYDFTQISIDYFYEKIFFDLGSRNKNGKLIMNLKWGVTFDEECAPIQILYQPNSDTRNPWKDATPWDNRSHRPRIFYRPKSRNLRPYRQYGTIDINGTPVFYYLLFTLQEILDAIKPSSN